MSNKQGMVNVDEYAIQVAHEALRLFKKEEKEKSKKERLHNMGLLMDHYIEFVEHYENIKYKASEIEDELDEQELELVSLDDIIIQSIKRSKIRTKVIISQIETSVRMLEVEMKAKGEIEKYKVIERLYMDRSLKDIKFNPRVKLIAEESKCGESSVRRWNNEMLDKLGVKLFGVDGLRLDI